jgi:hypothetical protein
MIFFFLKFLKISYTMYIKQIYKEQKFQKRLSKK